MSVPYRIVTCTNCNLEEASLILNGYFVWRDSQNRETVNAGVKSGRGAAQNWATLGFCGTRAVGGGQSAALSM